MYHTGHELAGKDLTSTFQQKYQDYLFAILNKLSCPHCQNPCGLKLHGRYLRHLYLNSTQRIKILVSRMICTCGRTFVILPPDVVPFKRYLLKEVLNTLWVARTHSRYQIEQQLAIAHSVLGYWLKQSQTWHQSIDKAICLW